jgi:hypothetical protein
MFFGAIVMSMIPDNTKAMIQDLSVITKSEGRRIEKIEGRAGGSERQIGLPLLAEDVVREGAITADGAA